MKTFLLSFVLVAGFPFFVSINDGMPSSVFTDMPSFVIYATWLGVFYVTGGVLLAFTVSDKNALGLGFLVALIILPLNSLVVSVNGLGISNPPTPTEYFSFVSFGVLLGIVATQLLRGKKLLASRHAGEVGG